MSMRRSALGSAITLVLLVALTSSSAPVSAGEPESKLVVIVAKDSPIDNLPFYDIKRLYKGDNVNAAGKRLIALNSSPTSKEREAFDRIVLGMDRDAVSRFWVDRKIRGQSGSPKVVEPPQLLQRVIGRLEGAVGYVRSRELRPEVKVVRIDGKWPTDEGYPLR